MTEHTPHMKPPIAKTCLYNLDPLKPHFYIVKLGFTGVYIIFLVSAQNIGCGYSLEPPVVSTHNLCFWAEVWKILEFFIWLFFSLFFIPRHTIVAGYYGFTLVVRVSVRPSVVRSSVRPSVFRFRMITSVNINGFSPNLVCTLILWGSALGLLVGKFRHFLTEWSDRDTPIFSFPDYNLSK